MGSKDAVVLKECTLAKIRKDNERYNERKERVFGVIRANPSISINRLAIEAKVSRHYASIWYFMYRRKNG